MKKYDLIYFMGDSFVVAINQYEDYHREINETNRWTNLVAAHYNLAHYNNGIAGCGNYTVLERVYRDIYYFLQKGKNPLAVICYSDPSRVELYNKKYKRHMVINEIQWDIEFYKSFITNYEESHANTKLSAIYIAAVQSFLLQHGVDFIECHSLNNPISDPLILDHTGLPKSLYDIAGPDGKFIMQPGAPSKYGHPNVLGNSRIAEAIIKKIDSLYTTI